MLIGAGAGLIVPMAVDARSFGTPDTSPQIDFALREISAAGSAGKRPAVGFQLDPAMGPQTYRFTAASPASVSIVAGDETGAMYAGLDVAEALMLGDDHLGALADGRVHAPHIAKRGIKFNIPLDLRTPSYSDGSTSARANIPEVWTLAFWSTYFDTMARNRYNVLSLWSLHPFPSMVSVPEFPDVALDDVWRSRHPLGPKPFPVRGEDAVPPEYLADHEVVKTITIQQKITFWRMVMQMAADRGIEVYVFTWNIFVYGAGGKHGITDSISNPTTLAYMRASVRELVRTYPLLAGIGITAGENLPANDPHVSQEQWLWATYGEGVRDGLKGQEQRIFRLIHRFHETKPGEIQEVWKNYPGFPETFTYSYKYSVARMYSATSPPFIAEAASFITPVHKTWLTVRNDDIYSFRWGDPDFARDYIVNMPPTDRLVGFYMGPDGYCWGRDFLDRADGGQDLGAKRPLVMQRQWYAFALWGRLAFDPTIPNSRFQSLITARFPQVSGAKLYDAIKRSSQIIPQVNRAFWRDIDLMFLPEACSYNKYTGDRPNIFLTVKDFMNGVAMPGAGTLSIRRWRDRLGKGLPLGGLSPLDCADALEGAGEATLAILADMHVPAGTSPGSELGRTRGDCEAMAHLGLYYAHKIRGACALALFDESANRDQHASAIAHLEQGVAAWQRYAAVRDAQYLPGFYCRIGWVDITALTTSAAQDVEIARGWKPGSLPFNPDAPEQHWDTILPAAGVTWSSVSAPCLVTGPVS
jgi:hypothetical protein